jgi:pimeloyl-ACP methyl ester carboxylesterase
MTSKTALDQSRHKRHKTPKTGNRLMNWSIGAAAVGALAGTALINRSRTKRAERDNPPLGKFLTVDGVRLHYLERGQGDPIVLLHGNGTMIEDWIVSGLLDELAKSRRVIAFDRPGFGHSERPRSRIWTPAAQAALIAEALRELKVEKPVVVGHSFGTLVAAALALDHPASVSKLVLLGGYFYPSVRADVLFASQPAVPVVGDVMRHTVSPFIGAAMMPRINAKIFNPAPVPKRWLEEFPFAMTLRPAQIRAESAEAAIMIPAAAALAPRFSELKMPVTIVAGHGDEMVTTASQSELLHAALPGSRFEAVEGAGHMVHHSATGRVLSAIDHA